MPKAKRQKIVPLTKTKGDQSKLKTDLIHKLEANFEKYNSVFVFNHENMTTLPFRDIQA